MRKIKIAPIMIAALFVAPVINVGENQTGLSPLKVDVLEGNASANETDRYFLNDTLSININITNDVGREFFIPRFLYATVIIMRDKDNVPLSPILSFFKRLIPVRMFPFGKNKANMRVDVTSEGNKVLNITMDYEVTNDTAQENLTMHLFVMGMLPGNINGLGEKLPIVAYKQINLIDVVYDFPE